MGADIKEMFTGFRRAVAEVRLQDLVAKARREDVTLDDVFIADAIVTASKNGKKVVKFRWDTLKEHRFEQARFYAAFDSAIRDLGYVPMSVPDDAIDGRLYLLEPKR